MRLDEMKRQRITDLLQAVVKWAEGAPDVYGAALVGSYARGEAKPDSDVDLVILTLNPSALIAEPDWINAFGSPRSLQVEDWGRLTSLRVWYREDLEVEFGITSLEWARVPLDEGSRRVIQDGMRILLDKTGLLEQAFAAAWDKHSV